jgi:hypothetical protein
MVESIGKIRWRYSEFNNNNMYLAISYNDRSLTLK